ncbi:extracellular solute-binding protein [Phototrophicus methaneseepsis]|uniref:Extracellular solute-binding protein n=1 Tax=Phototrophicus methaneseepsis TaxID=2710758 RepID=A0A7S8E7Z5_9CHLR|nr:extracellular solute-binding protein [Phototrophicus methaneseepsis]QPC82027.1 extracellular solute-binding protein [Phototrophicus methaneseepsis]
MFKSKKHLLFIVMALLLISSFAVSAQDSVTITFWSPFTGPDGQTIEEMVNEFNTTAGPEAGVQVEMLIVPWDEYYTKLTVAMASNQTPNLAIAHSHRVPAFAQEGTLLEFTPEALETLGITGEDYIPALWNAGEYEGARYALPIDAFPRNMFYNKTVFENAGLDPEAAPTNMEELTAALDAIKASGGEDMVPLFFSTSGSWAAREFYSLYMQYEPNLLNEDGTGVSENFQEAATKALEITTGFIDDGYALATPGDWTALFAQDQVGIVFAQITHLLSLSQIEDLDFGTAGFPTLGDTPANFTLGHNFILPIGSGQDEAHINASLTFINWFGDHALAWAAGGKVPATFAVIENPEFEAMEAQAIVTEQMDAMMLPPIIPEQSEIDVIVQENLEAIYGRQSSIEDAVNRMADEINALLG